MEEYSQKLKKEAKHLNIPVQTLIMADLMAIGYSKSDAYNIAYSTNATFTSAQNKSIRDSIIETDAFDDLLQQRTTMHTGLNTNLDEVEMITEMDVAKDILASARKQPIGSKDRADLMSKYYDIVKKIGSSSDGQEVVKVWLPLTCHICPFYKEKIRTDKTSQQ